MTLKIVIETRFCHPHFGGIETKMMEFNSLDIAEKEYKRLKEEDSKSNGYQNTTIQIVERVL